MTKQELKAIYDNRLSFYKKAFVLEFNGEFRLQSYGTIVAEIKDDRLYIYGEYSKTTMRHIREFIKQFYPRHSTDLKAIRETIKLSNEERQ